MIKKLLLALVLCSGFAFADIEQMMATVPNTATVVTARTTYVYVLLCSASSTTTLTVTDTAGNMYFNAIAVTANQTTMVYTGYPGLKMVGIKWSAGASSSVVCQLQGVQP